MKIEIVYIDTITEFGRLASTWKTYNYQVTGIRSSHLNQVQGLVLNVPDGLNLLPDTFPFNANATGSFLKIPAGLFPVIDFKDVDDQDIIMN